MTGSSYDADASLLRSVAAVWQSYLDAAAARVDATLRPGAMRRGSSAIWEAYRQNLAFGIAWFLTDVARRPFARLYASSLRAERANAVDR